MKKTLSILLTSFVLASGTAFANDNHDHSMHDHSMMDKKSDSNIIEVDVVNEQINGKNRYSPSVFIAKKGKKIRLNVHNVADNQHGFSISEFKVAATLEPKQKNVIEFTPDKTGLFKVFCQYHPAHLSGQLLVID